MQIINQQPEPFSPSVKEHYIITMIITCLEESNGKGQ